MNDRTADKGTTTTGFYTTTGREVPMVPTRRTKPAPWLALPDPDVEAAALAFPTGDRRAFGVLFHATRARVQAEITRRLGDASDADDVASMAYTTAWLKREAFTGDFNTFVGWMMGVATMHVLNWRRGRARLRHHEEADGAVHESVVEPAVEGDEFINADRAEFIREHAQRLAPGMREVVLWQLEGLSWAEMARRMDVSESRIRALWPLAIKRIQDAVAADTRVPRGIAPAPAPAWWWFDQFMEAVGSTL